MEVSDGKLSSSDGFPGGLGVGSLRKALCVNPVTPGGCPFGHEFCPGNTLPSPQASHVRRLRRDFFVYVSLTHIPLRNVENDGFSLVRRFHGV